MYICIYVYIMPITIIPASGDNPLCGKEAFFVRKSGLFHRERALFCTDPFAGKVVRLVEIGRCMRIHLTYISNIYHTSIGTYAYKYILYGPLCGKGYLLYGTFIDRYVCIQICIVRTPFLCVQRYLQYHSYIDRYVCIQICIVRTPLRKKIFAIYIIYT